ncbi:MAG: AAA family ATPase [Kiritimatiellae bacterium]|nr:AAA family ATPase [Kiritimatiellia bacterium]
MKDKTDKPQEPVKVLCFSAENFKAVKAVMCEPNEDGLTIIGGDNGAGKSTCLDILSFALGGAKYRPSNPKREGAIGDTTLHVELSNGLTVERKGKNLSLTVTDKEGARHGQELLDAFISNIAIDLPKFYNASAKDKAHMILETLGIEEKLAELAKREKEKYDTRTMVGREADRKQKAAEDMPWHEDAPEEKVSVKELIDQQQEILARNGIKEEHRRKHDANKAELDRVSDELSRLANRREQLMAELAAAEEEDFTLESTAELEAKIANFEETNRKVAENAERTRRMEEADALNDQKDALTKEIEDIRAERLALLKDADFPLEGLSVNDDSELVYNGQSWDCMSGSQQLIVSCAIASRINPTCRFVLMDKLEQLDLKTLAEFDAWLKTQDLQCIATRVSTGGECTLVIEDGEVKEGEKKKRVLIPRKAQPSETTPETALDDKDY